jgi:hypothetical protein
MILPGHRPQAAHLPEQPLQHLPTAQVLGQELAGFFREVQQDGSGFEQRKRLAAVARGWSTMAGMRLLGAIFRKSGLNWSPWPMLIGCTL